MPKHKQTASLGKLTNYTTPPEQPTISTEAEIEALKERVTTLELLLNDVMPPLDKPTREPEQQESPARKVGKNRKSKQTAFRTPAPQPRVEQQLEIVFTEAKIEGGLEAMLEAIRKNPKSLRSELAEILNIHPKLAGKQINLLLEREQMRLHKKTTEDGNPYSKFSIA